MSLVTLLANIALKLTEMSVRLFIELLKLVFGLLVKAMEAALAARADKEREGRRQPPAHNSKRRSQQWVKPSRRRR